MDQPKQYLAFHTKEKILGILKLPLEGNPNNSIAVISNPGDISWICTSRNGKFILTAGKNDLSLNIWNVDCSKLDNNNYLNTKINNLLEAYPDLLEGGEKG